MNRFKKFTAIISCAALVLSLAACSIGGKEEETTTAQSTTVAETTTSPLLNAETRFSHIATMNVWSKGKKVTYEEGASKIGAATAALNDSVVHDIFKASDKKTNIDDLKNKASCVEFIYESDQTAAFSGKKTVYDSLVVATSGDYVNLILLIKDSKIVLSIEVTQGENSAKALSENVKNAVKIIKYEDHTH